MYDRQDSFVNKEACIARMSTVAQRLSGAIA